MAISKITIIEDLWNLFYDRVKDQVTSIIRTNGDVITVQNYVSAYSDKMLSIKSNYPILVVESPSLNVNSFTMEKDLFDTKINIEIYTNQSDTADKLFSQIIESIETHKTIFRDNGISMLKLDSTDSDMVERGGFKIHMRQAIFKFKFYYTKTGAY